MGVSNFDVQDMEDLWKVPGGNQCCVNQVLYNLDSHGIEYDLMGCQRGKSVPFIAYGPVGQAEENNHILIAWFSRVGNTDFSDDVDAVSSASLNLQDGELLGNTELIANMI